MFEPFRSTFEWTSQTSFEIDPACTRVLEHRHKHLEHLGDVKNFDVNVFKEKFSRDRPQFLLLGAGSPCQNLSLAGNKEGLGGKESSKFYDFLRMKNELYALCEELHIKPYLIFENVVPQDKKVIDSITDLLGTGIPLMVDAADVSWISRRRLIWTDLFFLSEVSQFVNLATPEEGFYRLSVPRERRLLPALGSIFLSEYKPLFLEKSSTPAHPEGRFPVATNRLAPGQAPHGWHTASDNARKRCKQDGLVLPHYWYEDHALLWKEIQRNVWDWRTIHQDELEKLMGFPAGYTEVPASATGKKSQKLPSATRWRLLANTWQLACLKLCALAAVHSFGAAATDTSMFAECSLYIPWPGYEHQPSVDPFEELHGLRGYQFVQGYINLLDHRVQDLVIPYRHLFDAPCAMAPEKDSIAMHPSGLSLGPTARRTLNTMNPFAGFRDALGLPCAGLKPADLLEAEATAGLRASMEHQTGFHLRKGAVARVVPAGLSEWDHFEAAKELKQLPFDCPAPLALAARFAIDTSVDMGSDVKQFRRLVVSRLRQKSRNLSGLTAALKDLMEPQIRRIAGDQNLGIILYLQILLGWPDVHYVSRIIFGFQIMGELENLPIYRSSRRPNNNYTHPHSLFEADKDYSKKFSLKGEAADAMLEQTQKDIGKFASEPLTRSELDAKFGPSKWHAMRRFVLLQEHNPKWRAIDDGLRSGHNSAHSTSARVHTTEPAWVAGVTRRFHGHAAALTETAAQMKLDKVEMCGGCDDEQSAYRWKPVRPEDHRFSIVEYYDKTTQSPRYIIMYGLAFGLASAVLNYNRQPELLVEAMRCLFLCACSHIYDDHLTLEPSTSQGSGQASYVKLCTLIGICLDKDKHKEMRPVFLFTGCRFDTSLALSRGRFALSPKPGRLEKIISTFSDIRAFDALTSQDAAEIRGKVGFVSMQLQGRALRYVDGPLVERQYSTTGEDDVTPELDNALIFIEEAFRRLPTKTVELKAEEGIVLLYSDAAYEDDKPISYGWVCYVPGSQPTWGADTIPAATQDLLKQRKTQIYMGELLAAVSALWSNREVLKGRRVLHFIDNQPALATLISGAAKDFDSAASAFLYHLASIEIEAKVWLEYVDSDANVSDGPSRLLDAWALSDLCKRLGARKAKTVLPDLTEFLKSGQFSGEAYDMLLTLARAKRD